MRTFTIDFFQGVSFDDFVAAFNKGFCEPVLHDWEDRSESCLWSGGSWDAFHDYLSWPKENEFTLVFHGWNNSKALTSDDQKMILSILNDNTHVQPIFD